MIQSALMKKEEAIDLLGGDIAAAARAIGCSYNAVRQWPEELPSRIRDRVQAALWRKQLAVASAELPPSALQGVVGD